MVHNLKLAMTDPLADNNNETDDHSDGTADGTEGTAANDRISDVEDDRDDGHSTRAPP